MILTYIPNKFIETWIEQSRMLEEKLNSYIRSKSEKLDQDLIDFQDSILRSRLKIKIELSQK